MSNWGFIRVIESTALGRTGVGQNVAFVSGFLKYLHFREHLHNVSDACREHEAQTELMVFFSSLGLTEEFDRAWQWGVFDNWTHEPTVDRLEELVEVVQFGMY